MILFNKIFSIIKKVINKIRYQIRIRSRINQLKGRILSSKFDGAIVTLTVYNNYGNVLQRYALQKFLAIQNYNFTILDLKKDRINPNHKNLKNFTNKYVQQDVFSERASKYYKAYIVGSDQVWRHFSVNKTWKQFGIQFLDFVKYEKTKRIAYAASFGVDSLEEADINDFLFKKINPLIKKFDRVSVREKSGIQLAKKLGATKVEQVIDPTLLLESGIYSELIKEAKLKKKSSPIFYYLIQRTPLINESIYLYEQKYKGIAWGILPYSPTLTEPLPEVEAWLKGIRDARIVITDSYHAVAFSIIFHTDFIVFDKELGGTARIEELLKSLGLEDRLIKQDKNKKYVDNHHPINWIEVDKKLESMQKTSAAWLINSLEN
jgi:hypothetical protein